MTFQPYTTTFHQKAKEVMRITADSVTVALGVSVDEAAAAVIAALEQHMRNIVAAEREAIIALIEAYKVPVGNSAAGEMAAEWTMGALRDLRDAIRARSKA